MKTKIDLIWNTFCSSLLAILYLKELNIMKTTITFCLLLAALVVAQDENYIPPQSDCISEVGFDKAFTCLPQHEIKRTVSPFKDRVKIDFPESKFLLKSFLNEVTIAIEKNDWQTLLSHMDTEVFSIQVEDLGIPMGQFMYEALLDKSTFEPFRPLTGDNSSFAKLNAIESITLDTMQINPDATLSIKGQVELFDKSKRPIELLLKQYPTGRYVITSGVG